MKLFFYSEASGQITVTLSVEEAEMIFTKDEIEKIKNKDITTGEELETKLV
jgi:hypothetical protein